MKEMEIKSVAAAMLLALLSACSDQVPSVADPHHPNVDGVATTPSAFLEKYCVGKIDNATCEKVRTASSLDAAQPRLPKGW